MLPATHQDRLRASFEMRDQATDKPSGEWAPLTLAEVHADMVDRARQDGLYIASYPAPLDIIKPMQLWHFDCNGHDEFGGPNGRMTARVMTAHGFSDPFAFTRRGFVDLVSWMLPPGAIRTLDHLMQQDERGRLVASAVINKCVRDGDRKPKNVRLYDRYDPECQHEGIYPTIRAIVSDSYGAYSDVEFIEALMMEVGDENLPVLSYTVTDKTTRVRMALEPMDGPPQLGKPIGMLEISNSPVRGKAVTGKAGLWTLKCANGASGWSKELKRSWNHLGDMNRVREQLPDAIDAFRANISGALEQYDLAVNVQIEDSMLWLDQQLRGEISDKVLEEAQRNLHNPTASMAPMKSVARVFDALTYTAQTFREPATAEQVEQVGIRMLKRGLAESGGTKFIAVSKRGA